MLPFYVLKLRKRAAAAKGGQRLAELYGEMKTLLDELVSVVDRSMKTGAVNEPDGRAVEVSEIAGLP